MVAFKNFLFATSLLFSWVAAAPTSEASELNVFDKRALSLGSDASKVCESTYVRATQINNNGNSATVVDLTGCTALFFFKQDTLTAAYHIFCGNEATDADTAAENEQGSSYVGILAADSDHYTAAYNAIHDNNPDIEIGALQVYDTNLNGRSIFATASTGNHEITTDVKDKVCGEPDPS